MLGKYLSYIYCVLFAVFITSCGTQLYIPGESEEIYIQQQQSKFTVEDLRQGRTLYVNACAGCHYLHYPDEFTIAEWNRIYPEMKTRVYLETNALDQIYFYLITGAKDAQLNSQ
ncbi:MAG: hypothetical protein ACHQFW_00340 [Chitinophagales bacterium]